MLYLGRAERYEELIFMIDTLEDMRVELEKLLEGAEDPSVHSESWKEYQNSMLHRDFLRDTLMARKEDLCLRENETEDVKQVHHIRLLLHELALLEEDAILCEKHLKTNEATWVADEESFQAIRRAEAARLRQSLAILSRHTDTLHAESTELRDCLQQQGAARPSLRDKLRTVLESVPDVSHYDTLLTRSAREKLKRDHLVAELSNVTRRSDEHQARADVIDEYTAIKKKYEEVAHEARLARTITQI